MMYSEVVSKVVKHGIKFYLPFLVDSVDSVLTSSDTSRFLFGDTILFS